MTQILNKYVGNLVLLEMYKKYLISDSRVILIIHWQKFMKQSADCHKQKKDLQEEITL